MAVPIRAANGGTYYKPSYVSRVVFSDGTTKEFESEGTRAMKATTAYMMTDDEDSSLVWYRYKCRHFGNLPSW